MRCESVGGGEQLRVVEMFEKRKLKKNYNLQLQRAKNTNTQTENILKFIFVEFFFKYKRRHCSRTVIKNERKNNTIQYFHLNMDCVAIN